MFSKPLSLVLIYILTIFNFAILTLPFLLAIFPFMKIDGNHVTVLHYISFNPKLALFLLIFIISFLMVSYLLLDFLLGFSVISSLKGCTQYDKLKDYEYLHGIFTEVKKKFGEKSVKLYIKNNDEINAFAVGSLGRKAIVLTSGLIEHYAANIEDNQEFLIAIRSIMGHEMSHLINKDFLPGLLMITNQKVTNFVSEILTTIFKTVVRLTAFFGIHNEIIASIIFTIYNISNRILTFFNHYVVYNFYEFFRKFLSRATEYRCDRQSAKAFGGISMAFALSLLGKSGYITLFSTHPATQKRMKKVEIVEEKNAVIRPSIFNTTSNFCSIMLMPIICFCAAKISKADLFIEFYLYQHYPQIYHWLDNLFLMIRKIIMLPIIFH